MLKLHHIILAGILLSCLQSCDKSNADFSFSHTDPIGSSAKAFLTADDFEKLTVEIDYYTEYQLSPEVIDKLQTFLEQRLNKPGGVSIVIDDELTEEDTKVFYNGLRLVDMEKNHRDIYTTENNLAAYFMVLNGRITNSDAGGGTYYNTSAGIFPEMFYLIADTTEGLSRETLLSTALHHEAGHFLGLVNKGTPMV